MITAQNGIYKLDTDNTSYIFRECESGHLQHLYYGRKIHADAQVLCEKHVSIPGISLSGFFEDNLIPRITTKEVRESERVCQASAIKASEADAIPA